MVASAAQRNQNSASGAITLPIAGFCSSGIFGILGICTKLKMIAFCWLGHMTNQTLAAMIRPNHMPKPIIIIFATAFHLPPAPIPPYRVIKERRATASVRVPSGIDPGNASSPIIASSTSIL